MPNTKAVGVAFSDPQLDSVDVTGAATFTTVAASGASTFTSITATSSVTGSTMVSTAADGGVVSNSNAGIYILGSAITANTTTTTAPIGSLGITSNSTGRGKLFYSDGTKWQFMAIT